MLAILRRYLEADLKRTGRTGADLVFGRTPGAAFVSSTIDNWAKNAWRAFFHGPLKDSDDLRHLWTSTSRKP